MSDDARRDARDQVARDYRELARKAGTEISYSDAQKRVAEAMERGDRKRSEGNR